ncbi:hypothetical protein FORMB_17080 [Formosa sp. Hel1_33_131]|nr:hypothetical protein FORMB_17080 [Formosa sp. Hel1_33_131]
MAEFCTKCEINLGMKPSYEKPTLCEGCGKTFTISPLESIIDNSRLILAIATAVIAIAFISAIIYSFFKEF